MKNPQTKSPKATSQRYKIFSAIRNCVAIPLLLALLAAVFFPVGVAAIYAVPDPTPPPGWTPADVFPDGNFPGLSVVWEGTENPQDVASALQILFLMSLIALAPSLLLLMTGFTRIIIALSFMRQAMATQQMPPNQVLVGLALFLTLFIMTPTFRDLNNDALQPFSRGEITFEEAFDAGLRPIRSFMLDQLSRNQGGQYVQLFMDMAGIDYVQGDPEEGYQWGDGIPNYVLIPAFVLGELAWGFLIGFMIYLPFIVIDMVTASVLMAMGMMMLPPAMISMPFKIMLFLLVGGWGRYIGAVMYTFGGGN
ncbi:MAG: flagellar type III secretion system pore protein FliP [Defluviitaleaceae bacterium]|nr:flagellar type III secretion system pore protein FliP [Defluviitaleaceae bacterium]MCL2240543.1 flagellar type III secretion system pore protein FliP [Defluviitaleaceae bacterium]